MTQHLTLIKLGRTYLNVLTVSVIFGGLVFAWFATRWHVGDMLSETTSSNDPHAAEIAAAVIEMAPNSPRGYWLSGAVLKSAFEDASLNKAIEQFKLAARVAPHRYRTWMELGRAFEQDARYPEAELAFRQAVETAPEYAIPRWQLGNFYLRRGRIDDAATELRGAAKHSGPYRIQVFSIVWNVLGNDPSQVEQFAPETPESKAALAYFYGSINRPNDAIRAWNSIADDEKPQHRWAPQAIARDLMQHRSFVGALEFSRQAGIDPDAVPEAFTNGDFETPIKESKNSRFDWSLTRLDGKIDVTGDASTGRSGRRSLKFTFRGYSNQPFNILQQNLAVKGGKRYRLSFWVRTENLKSGSMPLIEVRNAFDDSLNAVSHPFPTGSNDWQQAAFEFVVPAERDGVYVRTAREACSGECPVTGIFWLDTFELNRL